MEKNLTPLFLHEQLQAALTWLYVNFLNMGTVLQAAGIALAFIAAYILSPWLTKRVVLVRWARRQKNKLGLLLQAVIPLALPGIWLVLQWLTLLAASHFGWPSNFINISVSLLAVWFVIRLTSSLLHDSLLARMVAVLVWIIAALNIVNALDTTIGFLDSMAITLGGLRISILVAIKGVISLSVLLWLAQEISQLLERRIRQAEALTPSVRVLLTKLVKIILAFIAVITALAVVGIDLSVFAFFTGAVGVGIGFGLQKIVSNLISGIILLLDKSIKPGDVITVGDTFGWVNTLGARYTSVVVQDGREFLIPNEDLITQQVENWSFSNNLIRIRIQLGISYKADVRKALGICVNAAKKTSRILSDPEPVCLLTGFGDSAVNLELMAWINDPVNGVMNVKSEILLLIWDEFQAQDIEIPFPQRDIHLKSSSPIVISRIPD